MTAPLRSILIAAAVLALAAGSAQAMARLKSNVTVDSAVLTVGDLFADAGAAAGREIGPAPAPGQSAVYQLRHLVSIAQANGLDWRPDADDIGVRVSRVGGDMPEAQVLALITAALHERGLDGRLEITLANRTSGVPAPRGSGGLPRVTSLDLDRRSSRFSARLAIPGVDQFPVVYGRVETVLELPVPVRTIPRGATIGAKDVEPREIRFSGAPNNVVSDDAQLVGMAARRVLRAGQPVRANELTAPIMVAKGSLVTLALHAPGIALSSTARALEDGARGDSIRLMNVRSKRTVEGTVVSPELVEVQLRRQIAASASR
ncbi:MAG TPA: flagellar basal body P-ring formation chaperone FlgA [Alphaproteobacteria bacterium]|jgi:flagella basal body P-ring formation protein FlgA|nr:flagellar basal body P-ring formation chaperone FlgA [Alphaproteobacteria bacterium]